MKPILNALPGRSEEHQRKKPIRDGAVHDTQGEVTRRPGFQKGHAKMGGSKKGSTNKYSRDLREAVMMAGEMHGSDGRGKDGLTGAFLHVLRKTPQAWSAIASKFISNRHSISNNDKSLDYETLEEIEQEMREAGIILIEESKE